MREETEDKHENATKHSKYRRSINKRRGHCGLGVWSVLEGEGGRQAINRWSLTLEGMEVGQYG